MIIPENETEMKIIESPLFVKAIQHVSRGTGHPEKNLAEHIEQILAFIDGQEWEGYRSDLRFLGLTHDLGKYPVQRDTQRKIIGKPHAQISEDIARENGFTSNERLLKLIRIHDKYFGFFQNERRNKPFKVVKFRKTFESADLDTLIRFNYADSNAREKVSIQWFEEKCVERGIRSSRIYEQYPGVLI